MENLTKEQLEKTIDTIKSFKQVISEKGSKEAVITYLMTETGLTNEECTLAYDIYNNIKLPERV